MLLWLQFWGGTPPERWCGQPCFSFYTYLDGFLLFFKARGTGGNRGVEGDLMVSGVSTSRAVTINK